MRTPLSHLKNILTIAHYQAPKNRTVNPVTISGGIEYIELLTNGKLYFEWGGTDTQFSRGAMFWHVPGERTICRFPPLEPYGCWVFRFAVTGPHRLCPRVTRPANAERLLDFAENAFRLFHSGQETNPFFMHCVYSTLAWHALGRQELPGSERPAALETALRFMEKNLEANISVRDIAEAASLSEPYLFAVFQKNLGTSPHRRLLEMRIARAKQLLAGGAPSVKETASECGFESVEVFYRQFSAVTGTTPGAYRRKYRPEEELRK